MFLPVLAQDSARTLSIFHRAIVDPGMNFEPAGPFGASIGENIMRPPAFEIPAPPDRDMLHVLELESAIDPTAASPLRRRDRPVRMIVERNENERLDESAQPKRAQVMIIARAVKRERREVRLNFEVKSFDDSRRCRET